mmetsp:Transcript_30509/g.49859  ORF Transcript_30509/g.49859 Transcript_30509/m.49859 type:complete len:234 (-) Transcript_30509:165-866(-)
MEHEFSCPVNASHAPPPASPHTVILEDGTWSSIILSMSSSCRCSSPSARSTLPKECLYSSIRDMPMPRAWARATRRLTSRSSSGARRAPASPSAARARARSDTRPAVESRHPPTCEERATRSTKTPSASAAASRRRPTKRAESKDPSALMAARPTFFPSNVISLSSLATAAERMAHSSMASAGSPSRTEGSRLSTSSIVSSPARRASLPTAYAALKKPTHTPSSSEPCVPAPF